MITRTPECRCLECRKPLADVPAARRLILCLRCGAVMIFTEDLRVRGMTEEEMDILCNDAESLKFLAGQVLGIQLVPKVPA